MFRVLLLPRLQKGFQLARQLRVFLQLCKQLLKIQTGLWLFYRGLELSLYNPHIRICVEGRLKLLCVDLALLVNDMGVDLCDHRGLCVSSVPLSGLNNGTDRL